LKYSSIYLNVFNIIAEWGLDLDERSTVLTADPAHPIGNGKKRGDSHA
jgi:hypothetical protein